MPFSEYVPENSINNEPTMSVRRNGFAFNTAAVETIGDQARCQVLLDKSTKSVAFRFAAQGGYTLSRDGGKAKGRTIVCQRLLNDNPWIKVGKYPIKYCRVEKAWIAKMGGG